MKTAEEILDLVCPNRPWPVGRKTDAMILKAMKLYANQKLDEAAEKANYKCIDKGDAGYEVIIDKQSILNLKDLT